MSNVNETAEVVATPETAMLDKTPETVDVPGATVIPTANGQGATVVLNTEAVSKEDSYEDELANMDGVTSVEVQTPISEIHADDAFNIRFFAGQTVGGVKITADLRDIGGMADSIRKIGRVLVPLVLSQRADGKKVLLCGYRRYNGVLQIRTTEPASPLAQKLATLPTRIYTGLTLEQERRLMNDQTSLDFSGSEVYRIFAEEIRGGAGWESIVARMYPQLGRIVGNQKKVMEVRQAKTQAEREKLLKGWMNTFANQFWKNTVLLGKFVHERVMTQYLKDDGYIDTEPDFRITSSNIGAVVKAWKDDNTAKEFDHKTGTGPRMVALFDTLRKKKLEPKTEPEYKFKKMDDYKVTVKSNEATGGSWVSSLLKMAFVGENHPDIVQRVANVEECYRVFVQHSAHLKPELRQIMSLVFGGGDGAKQFDALLASNYAEPESPADALATFPVATPEELDNVTVPEVETVPMETVSEGEPETVTVPAGGEEPASEEPKPAPKKKGKK